MVHCELWKFSRLQFLNDVLQQFAESLLRWREVGVAIVILSKWLLSLIYLDLLDILYRGKRKARNRRSVQQHLSYFKRFPKDVINHFNQLGFFNFTNVRWHAPVNTVPASFLQDLFFSILLFFFSIADLAFRCLFSFVDHALWSKQVHEILLYEMR